MRRLLVLLAPAVLAAGLVVAVPATAQADSGAAARCGAWSGGATGHEPLGKAAKRQIAVAKRQSDAVFEGQVTLPRQVAGRKPLHLSVQVVAVWKGDVAAPSQTTVVFRPGACRDWALAHPSPEDYVFFVDHRDGAWTATGDAPRVVGHSDGLTAVLGAPQQQPGGQQPQQVGFERVAASEPRSFTKVAAPGAALVIVALLGMLVVRRLGRRA